MLRPEVLAAADPAEVTDSVSSADLKVPAKVALMLKRLAGWFGSVFQSEDDCYDEATRPTSLLRSELLAISGIGQATADGILLSLGRPCYPVDHGTYRILLRHGWIDSSADYEEVHQLLNRQTGENAVDLARLSTWLTRVAREYCGVASPRCGRCPLRDFLPESGPVEPEG
jgi:endonuclease III-like uncharacterized protein